MPFLGDEARLARFLRISEALKDPVFRQARISRANDLLRNGAPLKKVRMELDAMLEAHEKWKEALRLHDQKVAVSQIARIVGRPSDTVYSWLNGRRPREVGSQVKRNPKRQEVSLPSTKETAFLAGLYSTRHLFRSGRNRISISEFHPFYPEILGALKTLGIPYSHQRKGMERAATAINSVEAIDAFEKMTQRRRRVPMALLDDEEKIRQYLRAVTLAGGNMAQNKRGGVHDLRFQIHLPASLREAGALFSKIGCSQGYITTKSRIG